MTQLVFKIAELRIHSYSLFDRFSIALSTIYFEMATSSSAEVFGFWIEREVQLYTLEENRVQRDLGTVRTMTNVRLEMTFPEVSVPIGTKRLLVEFHVL